MVLTVIVLACTVDGAIATKNGKIRTSAPISAECRKLVVGPEVAAELAFFMIAPRGLRLRNCRLKRFKQVYSIKEHDFAGGGNRVR